jgi:hypothetical protein
MKHSQCPPEKWRLRDPHCITDPAGIRPALLGVIYEEKKLQAI